MKTGLWLAGSLLPCAWNELKLLCFNTRKSHVARYLEITAGRLFLNKTEKVKVDFLRVKMFVPWLSEERVTWLQGQSELCSCGLNGRDKRLIPGALWICCCVTGGNSCPRSGLSD